MSSTEQKVINDLADEDLANIFEQLPPYERLLVSEVSKRWYGISRVPWLDVYHLDLSSIPGENIGAIVKQCPNLRTVFAKNKNFALNQLNSLSRANLSSLKLYQCSSVIRESEAESAPLFSAAFSDNLPNASWKEFVLCCADFVVERETENFNYVLGALPTSLERLQLNALNAISPRGHSVLCRHEGDLLTSSLRQLHHLTCLILCTSWDPAEFTSQWELLTGLRMNSLRELCIDCDSSSFRTFETLADDLPRLDILFLNNAIFLSDEEAKHPALRILCITGSFDEECTIPVRSRFPNGFGADPLPLLHVFVGKQASEMIVFTNSSANALEIHPITEPLPEFLEEEKIAPLFEIVWIAAQLKERESAKNGSNWWKCEDATTTSFRTANV